MIIKGSGIMYLFDFDGTLFGYNLNTKYSKRIKLKQIITSKEYINPNKFDVRWSILTSRPLFDKWILLLGCWSHEMYPEKVITHPSLFKRKFNDIEILEWKKSIIEDTLLKNSLIFNKLRPIIIEKVIYISNCIDTITYLNQHKIVSNLNYIGLTVHDFVEGKFNFLL